jgi:hypothetical protein
MGPTHHHCRTWCKFYHCQCCHTQRLCHCSLTGKCQSLLVLPQHRLAPVQPPLRRCSRTCSCRARARLSACYEAAGGEKWWQRDECAGSSLCWILSLPCLPGSPQHRLCVPSAAPPYSPALYPSPDSSMRSVWYGSCFREKATATARLI